MRDAGNSDFVIRMMEEASELRSKIHKIHSFLKTSDLSLVDRDLLGKQESYMRAYYSALCKRISIYRPDFTVDPLLYKATT